MTRYDQIPPDFKRELALVGEAESAHYPWRKGYNWADSFNQLEEHLNRFWEGENHDAETGFHHLSYVTWHALALREFSLHQKYDEYDDREDIPWVKQLQGQLRMYFHADNS